ncbi:MAG: hypothetical protein K2G44_01925 [Clostridia bacterium]|nr:hypothetical protein [Clostridia bacterium]
MLITDDKLLVESAEKNNSLFKVPVCSIMSGGNASNALSELDHKTSENKIGEIVNLSQKLNSLIWDKLNSGASTTDILPIYKDVCKLAVLSGLEIDKAKRAYDNVNVGAELTALRKKYNAPAPIFFQEIDEAYRNGEKQYTFYNTTMDYIYKAVKLFHFRKGKAKVKDYEPISRIFGNKTTSDNATNYRHRDKIIEICDEYKARLSKLYMALRSADEKEREVIYERIQDEKVERDHKVSRWLTSINVMLFVIRHYEKNSPSDWRIYAPLINTPLFQKEMLAYPVPEFLS